MENMQLDVEVDFKQSDIEALTQGYVWVGEGDFAGIEVEVHPLVGHGFGLTALIGISIAVATGVGTNLLTDAIKAAIRGTVRRARSHKSSQNAAGSREIDQNDFDLDSVTLDEAVAAEHSA